MEAFPATTLATADDVFHSAVPKQLHHALGVDCQLCADAESLREVLASRPPALLILDSALPDAPDAAAIRRDHPLMGILCIGGTAEIPLAVNLPRPLSAPRLVSALVELRYARELRAGQQRLPLPQGAFFHPAERLVTREGTSPLELTDKEAAMLGCLYHHRQGWLSRQDLLEEVWGYSESITTHTLETHLYRLRSKLRGLFGEEDIIITRNSSYRLADISTA